MIASANRL